MSILSKNVLFSMKILLHITLISTKDHFSLEQVQNYLCDVGVERGHQRLSPLLTSDRKGAQIPLMYLYHTKTDARRLNSDMLTTFLKRKKSPKIALF